MRQWHLHLHRFHAFDFSYAATSAKYFLAASHFLHGFFTFVFYLFSIFILCAGSIYDIDYATPPAADTPPPQYALPFFSWLMPVAFSLFR